LVVPKSIQWVQHNNYSCMSTGLILGGHVQVNLGYPGLAKASGR
jgi:hypothetical protein